MGFYVIRRVSDGWYLAPPGQLKSYYQRLERARRFTSRKAAEAELCPENEYVEFIGVTQ